VPARCAQPGSLEAVRPRLEPALAQVQQVVQAEAEAQLLGQQGKRRQGAAAAAAAGQEERQLKKGRA
jgi:hypothetical protein